MAARLWAAMAYRRVLCVVGVCAGALAIAGVVLLVGGREGGVSFLLDKYDLPYRNDGVNDMNDHSTGRIMSYSEGDRDVRERKYMLSKFDRLQSILNSIVNGPAGGPVASPPTPPPPVPGPRCGERGGPACPRPPAQPVLSYTERIIRRLRELQLRVNSAAKRQYRLEDKVGVFGTRNTFFCSCGDRFLFHSRSLLEHLVFRHRAMGSGLASMQELFPSLSVHRSICMETSVATSIHRRSLESITFCSCSSSA